MIACFQNTKKTHKEIKSKTSNKMVIPNVNIDDEAKFDSRFDEKTKSLKLLGKKAA